MLIKVHPIQNSVVGKIMRAGWDTKLLGKYYLTKVKENKIQQTPQIQGLLNNK
jgi:hypothetical protein